MPLFRSRRNELVVPNSDGTFAVMLNENGQAVIERILATVEDLLMSNPDDPSLARLHPTAYADDAERDGAYQLLAGEELRTNRHAEITAMRHSMGRNDLSEDELWGWLRTFNAVRLVAAARCGMDTDEDFTEVDLDALDDDGLFWLEVFELANFIQYSLLDALGD